MATDHPLRIVPLGGLGEVGMNCMLLEQQNAAIMIDCGVTFPSSDLGIDLYHPSFDHAVERYGPGGAAKLVGVVITHGHEDHIGALPYLLDVFDVPLWGPPHALALIRHRLTEHGFDLSRVPMHVIHPRKPFTVGPFEIEALRVTHSIADATALAIRADAGLLLHSGDFKIDPNPSDGELTDEARLSELGNEGIRLLFSDSTGIDSQGVTRSEGEVAETLDTIIGTCPSRVIVGLFASNVQRLTTLGRIARKHQRKVCLLGRSMHTHVEVAKSLGRLDWPSDLIVSPEAASKMPPVEVLLLATGTQAEPRAALARLAQGTHNQLRVESGDVLIMSSRIIPGNDRNVVDMMGDFLRRGVRVISRASDPGVHASGHAYRQEQSQMIQMTKPRAMLPVHGTLHHLSRHGDLARSLGLSEVVVAENGDILTISQAEPLRKTGERVPSGRVAIANTEPIHDEVIRGRARIARTGVLSVAVVLDAAGRSLIAPPSADAEGVLADVDRDVLEDVRRAVARQAERALARGQSGGALKDTIRFAALRAVQDAIGQRPRVTVLVSQVGARD